MPNERKKFTFIENVGQALFLTRGLMSIFYVGLVWVIVILLVKFVFMLKDLTLAALLNNSDKTDIVIYVLEIVDLVMISQLVWIVSIAGFSLFVSSKYFDRKEVLKPEWLNSVDTYGLKLKLAFSIIAISGIHALRVYLENYEINLSVLFAVLIHFIFVLSAIGVAVSMKVGQKARIEKIEEENGY